MGYTGPQPGVMEMDLHGKNAYQARICLDSALKKADGSVYRIRVIHGYHGGNTLRELTLSYESHPRVKKIRQAGDGCTELLLRE